MSDTLKIKVWSDSNANIHSRNEDEMEIDREDWETMSEEEKEEMVKEYLYGNSMLDWGWTEPK